MFAFGIVLICFSAVFFVAALMQTAILMIGLAVIGAALFIGGCVLMAGGGAAEAFRRAPITPPAATAKAIGPTTTPAPAPSPKSTLPSDGPPTLASTNVTERSILFRHEPMIDLVLALAPGDAALDALLAYLRSAVRDQTGADAIDWPALKSRLKVRRPREADARAALAEIGQWSVEAKDRAAATLAEIYRLVLAPDPALRAEIARVLGRAV